MSDLHGANVESRQEPENEVITFDYGDGGLPWWVMLYWIAFIVFFIAYMIIWYFPDLDRWVENTLRMCGFPA